jgi:hypothetical protein
MSDAYLMRLLRFLFWLTWHSAGYLLLLLAVGLLLVVSVPLGESLAAALGGSLPAKVAGFVVAFVVFLG